jgi:hypothetical protein
MGPGDWQKVSRHSLSWLLQSVPALFQCHVQIYLLASWLGFSYNSYCISCVVIWHRSRAPCSDEGARSGMPSPSTIKESCWSIPGRQPSHSNPLMVYGVLVSFSASNYFPSPSDSVPTTTTSYENIKSVVIEMNCIFNSTS